MSAPRRSVLPLAGLALTVICGIGGLVIRAIDPAPILPTTFGVGPVSLIAIAALGITWSTVGTILAIRRPINAVGRIMIVVGAGHALSVIAVAVAFAAFAERTDAGRAVASFAGALTSLVTPVIVLVFYLAFIFPTGRGHTPRWHTIGRLYLWLTMIPATLLVLQPGDLHLLPGIPNPIGIGPDLRPVFGERVAGGVAAFAAAVVAPVVTLSVLSRYRLAGSIERHQLKWFILANALTTGAIVVMATGAALTRDPLGETLLIGFAAAGSTVPIAIGIAILRYRLYEIDRLVSRTISYGLVSGGVAAAYGATLVILQAALGSATGANTLTVAASTLVAAALFNPLRRRTIASVDRQFHRARYDAERISAALAERVRNEVDLTTLAADLDRTLRVALEPAHIGIWLRQRRLHRGP